MPNPLLRELHFIHERIAANPVIYDSPGNSYASSSTWDPLGMSERGDSGTPMLPLAKELLLLKRVSARVKLNLSLPPAPKATPLMDELTPALSQGNRLVRCEPDPRFSVCGNSRLKLLPATDGGRDARRACPGS